MRKKDWLAGKLNCSVALQHIYSPQNKYNNTYPQRKASRVEPHARKVSCRPGQPSGLGWQCRVSAGTRGRGARRRCSRAVARYSRSVSALRDAAASTRPRASSDRSVVHECHMTQRTTASLLRLVWRLHDVLCPGPLHCREDIHLHQHRLRSQYFLIFLNM